MQTITSAIDWWARIRPQQTAITFGDDRLDYRGLRDWSWRIASLLEEQGVQPGDRVAVCAANAMPYCALLLGILRARAIAVPLNYRYTARELGELIEDTAPRVLFATADIAERLAQVDVRIESLSSLEQLRQGSKAEPVSQPDPDDAVCIIATSGSTAKPKGVMFSNRSMTSYAAGFALEEDGIGPGARVIVPAPLSTSAGFVQLMHYTVTGCTLFFESSFDPQQYLQLLQDERITAFGGTPVFFERIADCEQFDDADLSSLRVATTGGARVSRALQKRWASKGVVLRQIYGQTECGGNATVMPADLAAAAPEKCGRGGIFTELAIVDSDDRRLPPGEVGQIVIRGPSTMIGYWNHPEETARTLRDGWLYTGDLGMLDADGMLTFVDRMKDIIISGGLNISAAEVERAVSEFPGIEEVVVIAATDSRFGETPLAVVHAREPLDVEALVRYCNSCLADYKVPRYVAVEPEPLPRLATGKLSKPALREKYREAASILERVR